jgi:hypothetical protein
VLKRQIKDQRTRVFQSRNNPSLICGIWTDQEVLLRFVGHERLHTAYVEKTPP